MSRIIVTIFVVSIVVGGLFAAEPETSITTHETCDTLYMGPPDGAWQLQANWTAGIPGPDQLAGLEPQQSGVLSPESS